MGAVVNWLFSEPHRDEIALLADADRLLAARPPGRLGREELRATTKEHGCDLATAMAYRAAQGEPVNAAFLAALAALPVALDAQSGRGQRLLVIPTMYHRERPELGGDGRLIAEIAARLGFTVETAAIASLGAITPNAAVLADHLRGWDRPGWVVSLSKGTSDLKRALCVEPGLAARVAGWISLAGMPGGTPLADPRPGRPVAHALLVAWLRLRGADGSMMSEMGLDHDFSRAVLALPAGLPTVDIVPMPLACHLRQPVTRYAAWLGRSGPNDGYVLLEDACIAQGHLVPLWGSDHYMRTPELPPLLYRLLRWAAELRRGG